MSMAEKLRVLQEKNIPKMKWEDLIKVTKGELTEQDKTDLDEYFEAFCDQEAGCPGCDGERPVIEWGLAHGEAHCVNCGWQYRGHHRNIGPVGHLTNVFLAYHPDCFEVVDKKAQ